MGYSFNERQFDEASHATETPKRQEPTHDSSQMNNFHRVTGSEAYNPNNGSPYPLNRSDYNDSETTSNRLEKRRTSGQITDSRK